MQRNIHHSSLALVLSPDKGHGAAEPVRIDCAPGNPYNEHNRDVNYTVDNIAKPAAKVVIAKQSNLVFFRVIATHPSGARNVSEAVCLLLVRLNLGIFR